LNNDNNEDFVEQSMPEEQGGNQFEFEVQEP
jgi:hypothetical protein